MYRIYADDTLIFDSTLDDYKIGQGVVTLELDKSGSFVFSVYPDHPYYDSFIRKRTVITVYKSGRIVFRGRVLSDVTNYQNHKVLTCEGEMGFLLDSIIRPFAFTGAHADLFAQFIAEHNEQVDEFKQFKVGTVTVVDENNYINRSGTGYDTTLDTLKSALSGSALGGHFFITHGDDGTDPIPTIHYLADFTRTATQIIEFGENLRDYTRTVNTEELATAIIPLGTENGSDGERLTIADVNGGKDYVYSAAGVALRGWIFKKVIWEDVTLANNLKKKAEAYAKNSVNQNVTIELNSIDMHLLNRSIESIQMGDNVHAISTPHGLDEVMLCNKQTMNLLNPESDTVTLGFHTATFTDRSSYMASSISTLGKQVSSVKQEAASIKLSVEEVDTSLSALELTTNQIKSTVSSHTSSINSLQSQITQTANEISAVVAAVDDSTGHVTAASIVAAINATSGDSLVQISAEHINLDGITTFTSSNLHQQGDAQYMAVQIAAGELSFLHTNDVSAGGTIYYRNDMDHLIMTSRASCTVRANADLDLEGAYVNVWTFGQTGNTDDLTDAHIVRWWFTTDGIYGFNKNGEIIKTVSLVS